MAIRTGEQLLQSLRDGRQLFIDGDRVEDVTTDRAFRRNGAKPRPALRPTARPVAHRPIFDRAL
jgi:4-hydroxyphenylacetate 3-monooxygenase